MPQAVVIYATNPSGAILTIANDSNGTDVNMPGGGIERGETTEEAARRELWEETGLLAGTMSEIFSGEQNGKFVTVFRAFNLSGSFRSSSEGEVGWATKEDVEGSKYGKFFKKMLASIE
jgi:8-oxo-dGTP pyrophosphatase MutT (NUDIX family)